MHSGKNSLPESETRGAPFQLRDVLAGLIRRRGLAETSATDELNTVWKEVVGAELGQVSKVKKVSAGVLEIMVFNGPALEQLRSFVHQTALLAMQQRFPDSAIRSIRYRRSR
jgi:predicted nucleic acid-binding Zn ribbon protein